ncbi:hypothetical protein EBU71_06545 [bacterium]|nr:hypothetical protein [Candidatus Elulimicrobium humile]
MSNPTKFLALTIFIVAIWTVNLFLLPRITTETKSINNAKNELAVKKAFDDSSPANIAKSVNAFVPKQFDKNKLFNLIDGLAKESGISISSLDIQIDAPNRPSSTPTMETDSAPSKSNTLKSINISISISGQKSSIDSFLSKLVGSKQYIDIQDISFSFNTDSESEIVTEKVESTIIAKTYYIQL